MMLLRAPKLSIHDVVTPKRHGVVKSWRRNPAPTWDAEAERLYRWWLQASPKMLLDFARKHDAEPILVAWMALEVGLDAFTFTEGGVAALAGQILEIAMRWTEGRADSDEIERGRTLLDPLINTATAVKNRAAPYSDPEDESLRAPRSSWSEDAFRQAFQQYWAAHAVYRAFSAVAWASAPRRPRTGVFGQSFQARMYSQAGLAAYDLAKAQPGYYYDENTFPDESQYAAPAADAMRRALSFQYARVLEHSPEAAILYRLVAERGGDRAVDDAFNDRLAAGDYRRVLDAIREVCASPSAYDHAAREKRLRSVVRGVAL